MLRLRPSELTLAPEDVEETFRRLRQRRISGTMSSRASTQSGRPILRRGPQKATQDAITALGNIPILRPSPQQAVYTSVDNDMDNDLDYQAEAPPMHRVDDALGTSSPTQNSPWALASTAASSALRTMHLPFRLGRDSQTSHTEATPDEQVAEATSRPPADAPEYAALGPFSPASRDNTNARTLSTENLTELRGGGGRPRRRPSHTAGRDPSNAGTPSQQMQRPDSPHRREPSSNNTEPEEHLDEDRPTLYLQGYFKDPRDDPVGVDYHFIDVIPQLPQTEPHRRGGRQPMLIRSLSSGHAPTFAIPTQRPAPSGSSADDVFGPVPAPEPPMGSSHTSSQNYGSYPYAMAFANDSPHQVDQGGAKSRQFSSETSSASAAFSYYGSDLLESRQSSSGQLEQLPSASVQEDGTMASGRNSDSAHDPARQSEHDMPSDSLRRPTSSTGSSQSSRNLASSAQHSISPLPSMPYNRLHSAHSSSQPVPGLVGGYDSNGIYIDAADAATQDLRSPLDDYSRHYQLALHVQRQAQYARHSMPTQPTSRPYQLDGANTSRPRQGMDSSHYGINHIPRGSWRIDPRQPQQSLPWSPSVLPPHLSSDQGPYPASQIPQSYGINSNRTRNNYRSSENTPANPTSNEAQVPRLSEVQREALGVSQSAVQSTQTANTRPSQAFPQGQSRSSIPQTALPSDMSNRPRSNATHHPTYIPPYRRNNQTSNTPFPPIRPQLPPNTAVPNGAPVAPGIPPRRGPSRQHTTSRARGVRNGNRTHFSRPPSTTHLEPSHYNTQATLANRHTTAGPISRPPSRSPALHHPTGIVPGATATARPTLPRPSARQHDQENSGEGEMALMRREERGINARYGEAQEGDREVMDETPPRVGRVERRMFE